MIWRKIQRKMKVFLLFFNTQESWFDFSSSFYYSWVIYLISLSIFLQFSWERFLVCYSSKSGTNSLLHFYRLYHTVLSWGPLQNGCQEEVLSWRFRKAGRVWCGGARETHWATWHNGVTVRKKWTHSNLHAFQDLDDSILKWPYLIISTFENVR